MSCAVAASTACTFLVSFEDPVDDPEAEEDAGVTPEAATRTDGATSTGPDPRCVVNGTPVADGTLYAPVGDRLERCCGGRKARVDSNEHCGVCGMACDTAQGQSCARVGTQYYCVGCAKDGNATVHTRCARSTGCCAGTVTGGVCAACNPGAEGCNEALCRSRGGQCDPASAAGVVCTYF